ncbi:pentapeptide repeat-containing protein [bacterium]|nr:pentapeptide repeat-containing protein [bacterium]
MSVFKRVFVDFQLDTDSVFKAVHSAFIKSVGFDFNNIALFKRKRLIGSNFDGILFQVGENTVAFTYINKINRKTVRSWNDSGVINLNFLFLKLFRKVDLFENRFVVKIVNRRNKFEKVADFVIVDYRYGRAADSSAENSFLKDCKSLFRFEYLVLQSVDFFFKSSEFKVVTLLVFRICRSGLCRFFSFLLLYFRLFSGRLFSSFRRCSFSRCRFSRCRFSRCSFSRCSIYRCRFRRCSLYRRSFSRCFRSCFRVIVLILSRSLRLLSP